jgi:hypothetical protein
MRLENVFLAGHLLTRPRLTSSSTAPLSHARLRWRGRVAEGMESHTGTGI